ncbi:MAG: MoaD/ThiS family protein [Desulfobacterales bacterium]|nr:MoaD/ThiS family protein [Desulfobacterales bacterium]
MMQVTVKYFGLASSRTGKRSEVWTLPAAATFATLKGLLHKEYSFDANMTVFYNLNGKGITEDAVCHLADGDLVMVIPQISGG